MNKYFVYDTDNNDFETYAMIEEQSKAAKEIIESYLDDNEWVADVEDIVSGVITERAMQRDRIDRSNDINEKQYWPNDIEYSCNYKMKKSGIATSYPSSSLS